MNQSTAKISKISMQDSTERMKTLLTNREFCSVPRGEVWIGRAFLERAGLDDTLDNHFVVAGQLGQEMVALPVSEKPEQSADMGYRYFAHGELSSSLRERTRFLAAVVDAPFQRLVNQNGLMKVIMSLIQERDATVAAYAKEQKVALELMERSLEKGIDAIILADDLAGDHAPFINPLDLDALCTPFYTQAVSLIRRSGSVLLLHSCGNLRKLVPLIKSWKLDGLAAIQICNNDMDLLEKEIGGVLIAGIDAHLLGTDSPPPDEMEAMKRFVARVAGRKGLILCSSCGLYNPDFWGRFQRIYEELNRDLPHIMC